jgi:hypothetical protein
MMKSSLFSQLLIIKWWGMDCLSWKNRRNLSKTQKNWKISLISRFCSRRSEMRTCIGGLCWSWTSDLTLIRGALWPTELIALSHSTKRTEKRADAQAATIYGSFIFCSSSSIIYRPALFHHWFIMKWWKMDAGTMMDRNNGRSMKDELPTSHQVFFIFGVASLTGALNVLLKRLISLWRQCFKRYFLYPYEGGDPAAPSSTATLLRLHPSH